MYKSKLGPNQCPCGVQCTGRDDLNNHIEKVHSPEHWTCSYPECPKFYNTRGTIWKHYQVKHLKALTGSVQKSTVIGDMKKNKH